MQGTSSSNKKEHSLKFNNTYRAFRFGHVVLLWPKSLHTEHLFFLVGNDSPTPCCLLYLLLPSLLGSTYGRGISLSMISKGTIQESSGGTG
ncbi:hypothetical protein H5410_002142 [Solanum commersonii]|uniref:Uncharacterized protein n=1 Tax=Solanum commersonii TaxID=4109 RepID=A0A9J6B153_SOLCO|nr:hypothetical protein H5410_002142 [Solanum commersonii]